MNKIVNLLETGEKQWGCELLPYNFTSRNKTKQSNLLTLTVSCEKRTSCLISSKKRSQNKTKKKKEKRDWEIDKGDNGSNNSNIIAS